MAEHQQIQQSKKPDPTFQKQATPASPSHESNPSSIIQRAKINPKSLSHADVMQLQRSIGNQAVGKLLSGLGNPFTAQQAPVQREESPEEDEETLQGKMMDTVQCQIPEDEEELMQGKFTSGLTGTLQAKEEAPPNKTGMPDRLKSGIENISGMDLSGVRVHYNSSKPEQLNALAYTQGQEIHVAPGQEKHLPHEAWHVVQQAQERVKPTMQLKDGVPVNADEGLEHEADVMGAKAFTSGQDVFLQQGAYEPGSRGGQKLIAHELTHVVQQTENTLSRAVLQQSQHLGQGEVDIIQRQFQPATTTNNAHLRNDGVWGTYVGNRIDSGSEIVVDQTQHRTETHLLRSDTTWTKAVNVTGLNWTWGAHNGHTTYIRNSRIGAAKQYPQRADDVYKPSRRKYVERPQLNWHHRTGEFVEIEDSVTTANAKVAYHKGSYKRITPATGQIDNLDANEQLQLDTPALEGHLFNRVRTVLTDATDTVAWGDKLKTDANIEKVMCSKGGGSKALRFDDFGKILSGEKFVAYFKWVTADNGPFHRIQEGAEYVRGSLEHWRKWLYPPDGTGVTITSISLTGSDLHENGLGVMFVRFNKDNAGLNADYSAAGDHELVVKPEERVLEQRLFGTEDDSLAKTINAQVGLAGPAQIATYKQKVDAGFGTLCEKVVAPQAKNLPRDLVRPITQAMKESLVFVLITGLTDLHGENVLWDAHGKPYMIDADNALKLKYMTPGEATAQSGYTDYAGSGRASETLKKVYASSPGYETAIMQALTTPGTAEQERLLSKVKAIFSGSVGRTVPIETAVWGGRLKEFIVCLNEGLNTDRAISGTAPTTKWQWCDYYASTVPQGKGASAPGLKGEVGIRGGTDGNFQHGQERTQLYADFKMGQIPFYNYQYGTGNVLHNGQVIWSGQTITERMAGLFTLFPNQKVV